MNHDDLVVDVYIQHTEYIWFVLRQEKNTPCMTVI